MAKGSRRSLPTSPLAAAVVSDAKIEPRKTPCCQSNASAIRGTTLARRPPNRMAEIGTPCGSSNSAATAGSWRTDAVKRAFGFAAAVPAAGVQCCRSQSIRWVGGSSVMSSHHTSPSSVRAGLVKMQLASVSMALRFVRSLLPGAIPKKPFSGLTAQRRPSGPNLSQQVSSPTVSAFHPGKVGTSMARLVLPHVEGNAPVM